ncbi:glycosyltransferase family 39 protein [bacterium]|nr:glycosyltransferase family 39 protein [bacterium]
MNSLGMPGCPDAHNSSKSVWVLLAIVGFSAGVFLAGFQKDLPYLHEGDEQIYVKRAIRIAASGDLNPRWFGNPGSTVIYPLVLIFDFWHAIEHDGRLLRPDGSLTAVFYDNQSEFYLLGRLLTILYGVFSVPLVFLIGRRLFSDNVALIGAWFFVLPPLIVAHAQVVRTDTPATFFGLLSIWLCLKILDKPTPRNHTLAGLSIGLAIATRYFMAALIPILLAVDLYIIYRQRSEHDERPVWPAIIAGLLAVVLAFVLSTPFFFLDFSKAIQDMGNEGRSTHAGADGLSFLGNARWYLAKSIPASITWPIALLALMGAVLVIRSGRLDGILVLGFVGIFIIGTSLLALHWARWMLQILPILMLFAAKSLSEIAMRLPRLIKRRLVDSRRITVALVLLFSIQPIHSLVLYEIAEASPGTHVLAREWMLRNLPVGSKIAKEGYSIPLNATDFVVSNRFVLPDGKSIRAYYDAGYRYLVASSAIYDRFLPEPERHPKEVAFYRELFTRGHLLKEFQPSFLSGGPTIRIYELREP